MAWRAMPSSVAATPAARSVKFGNRASAASTVGLAPNGIVEFVPKSDPMVQRLLRLREDIFDDYGEETFAQHLQARAKIVQVVDVSATGRRLFWFARS